MKDQNFNGVVEIVTEVAKRMPMHKIYLEASSIALNRCVGQIRHIRGIIAFGIIWISGRSLFLKMILGDLKFVDTISEVIGYKPCCQYLARKGELLVFEWNNKNLNQRFAELEGEERKGFIKDLQKI